MSEFARQFGASQIIGARERQEDDYAALDLSDEGRERLLFVLADGMGGHRGAATVAQLAVRRFGEIVQSCDGAMAQRLPRALAGTNDAIAKAAILDGTLEGAGCAFLSAAIDDGALSWTSVGDCSLYLFHGGKLRKLNDDHSMRPVIAASVAAGRVSAKAAAQDPRRNSLRSALKGGEIRLIDNSREPIHLRPGDGVLLASDGLETLSDRTIVKLLRRGSRVAPARIVERLLTAIGASGTRNQDNTTVIFYRFAQSGDVGQGSGISGGRLFLYLVLAAVLLSAVVYGLHISSH